MKNFIGFIVLIVAVCSKLQAQHSEGNPFLRLGYKADVYTFGEKKEFHDQEEIVEIGDIFFNTKTNEVVGFVENNTDSLIELQPELQSMSIDPHCEKYYSISSYVYGLNTPHNCIDPDGQKIIFVNGYLGFGSPRGGGTYWGGVNSSFVKGAKNFFNDQSAYFTDFDFNYLRSSTFLRNLDGYAYAKENYKQLIMGMNPQEDVFRIISHSMGGAFSEGIIRYLKEQGWNVDFSIHLNTWLPSELMGSVGTFLIDATITNDWVQGLSLPIDGSRDIPNANYKIRKKSNEGYQYRHRDWIDSGSFWNANNGITWNQLMPILDSWLIQNPNIQINYGQ